MSEVLRFPDGDPVPAPSPETDERLLASARREHALQSLLELGRELTVALGVHETADLLLFNLMGQLRTARSAIWLFPDDEAVVQPVLVRAHGFHRPVLDAIGSACAPALRKRFQGEGAPALSWTLRDELGTAEFELVRHASIAIVAPLHARDELLGWLVLGERVDASSYSAGDLQVLEAALGIVAVSLQNVRLYNRAREMNRRLRITNDNLSELDRLKTDFLSNVNHELRTPLAVVMASLECLVDMDAADSRTRGLLEASLRQSKKLNGLIENLLTFSEAMNSKLVVRSVAADAAAVIRECYEERAPGVAAGLRELAYRASPQLPQAMFDRVRVLQIVNELIDNAVKFTPRGSHIDIRLTHAAEDNRDWIQIEVSDNGPGIVAERMGTLFQSFEQVDGSSTRRVGGLGMGLAFAHQLALHMDARLTATSAIGQGSTFRLMLPTPFSLRTRLYAREYEHCVWHPCPTDLDQRNRPVQSRLPPRELQQRLG